MGVPVVISLNPLYNFIAACDSLVVKFLVA
jgi:hypothetical protein